MITSKAVLLVLVLTSPMFAQDTPDRSPTTTTKPAVDNPVTLVERLSEMSKHLSGFTAKYHGVSHDEPFDLRLVYRAPDSARLEFIDDTGSMATWILDGHAFIRGDGEAKTLASDLDIKKEFGANGGFVKVLEAEFPPPDGYDPRGGPFFSVWPASAKESGKSLSTSVSWYTPRMPLLAWLAHPKDWADAKQADGKLVRELKDGSQVVLSLTTGFIESISRPDGAHMELTSFSESVDEADFVVPEPKPDAKDEMAKVKAGLPALVDLMRRAVIYSRMSYEKDTTGEAFQTKLAKVFDALFTPDAVAWHDRLDKELGTNVDAFATWSHDRFKQIGGDAQARRELHQQIAERRTFYDQGMEKVLQGHVFEMRGLDEIGFTKELIDRVHAVERETYETVGRRVAADPFLAKFDAAMSDAEFGK